MSDDRLSPRLARIVDQLPLEHGMRVLEIGCGPGAAARAVARRIGDGRVLGIDRSERAIAAAQAGAERWGLTRVLAFQCVAIEDLDLVDAPRFDLAFAVRVGSLDGRHPSPEAHRRIRAALAPAGRLLVGGHDLVEVPLPRR